MGISKSSKYTAGVSVFSGRPDPIWAVGEEVAGKLLTVFEDLHSYEGAAVSAPPLGYRGAFLRDDAGNEWFAYRGVVTLTSSQSSELRTDADRAFERALLASIPEGLIPPTLLTQEFY
jgi:hypothetical protein